MPKQNKHNKKRARLSKASDSSMANSDNDLHKLDDLLESFSHDEESARKAVSIILNKEVIKNVISETFADKINIMQSQINLLETRLDDLEQYSRRNCLKLTGIPENKGENKLVKVESRKR